MEATGRVLQVSVSSGGLPKLPVERAFVSRLGVDGDAHSERTVHGGPHRAVCLFGIEAIERLQSEGHPVEPGSVGENLTTSGIEWSTLPIGTRARVGEQLLLEIASSTTPCDTQRPNFRDGRFSRINIAIHPSDSRMYARVLEEGFVQAGDAVTLLPVAAESRASIDVLLARIERPEKSASLKLWSAARAAGFDVRVLDDGDICAGASPELREPQFNHAQGLRMMPQLLPEILYHFRAAGTSGLIPHVAPVADAPLHEKVAVHAAAAGELRPEVAPREIDVVQLDGDGNRDGDARREWIEIAVEEMPPDRAGAWRALLPHLLAERDVHAFLARAEGRPAGIGLLFTRRQTGLLRRARVRKELRGRGIQRALIVARARAALDLGCDLVASMAAVDSTSSRNLAASGLAHIDTHPVYHYTPQGG